MLKTAPLTIALILLAASARAETPRAGDPMSKAQIRNRLAACATEWQQMKRSGREGSLIWREFSKICMERDPQPRKENASPIR